MKLWPSRAVVIGGVSTRKVNESAIEFLQRPQDFTSGVKPGSASRMVSTTPFEKPADGQRTRYADNDADHAHKRIHKNTLRDVLKDRRADTVGQLGDAHPAGVAWPWGLISFLFTAVSALALSATPTSSVEPRLPWLKAKALDHPVLPHCA